MQTTTDGTRVLTTWERIALDTVEVLIADGVEPFAAYGIAAGEVAPYVDKAFVEWFTDGTRTLGEDGRPRLTDHGRAVVGFSTETPEMHFWEVRGEWFVSGCGKHREDIAGTGHERPVGPACERCVEYAASIGLDLFTRTRVIVTEAGEVE